MKCLDEWNAVQVADRLQAPRKRSGRNPRFRAPDASPAVGREAAPSFVTPGRPNLFQLGPDRLCLRKTYTQELFSILNQSLRGEKIFQSVRFCDVLRY